MVCWKWRTYISFMGLEKMQQQCKIIDNIRQQIEFNSKSLSDKDIQLLTLSLNFFLIQAGPHPLLIVFATSTGELLDSVKICKFSTKILLT